MTTGQSPPEWGGALGFSEGGTDPLAPLATGLRTRVIDLQLKLEIIASETIFKVKLLLVNIYGL